MQLVATITCLCRLEIALTGIRIQQMDVDGGEQGISNLFRILSDYILGF
jgi:hypothetical protein